MVAPSRKQGVTEKTNFFLQSRKARVYSNKILSLLKTQKTPTILGWFHTDFLEIIDQSF